MYSQIVAIWADRSSKHGSDLHRLNRPVGIPLPEDPKPFGRPLRRRRSRNRSVDPHKGIVNQLLERDADAAALILRLLHQNVDHVELRIDTEIGTAA